MKARVAAFSFRCNKEKNMYDGNSKKLKDDIMKIITKQLDGSSQSVLGLTDDVREEIMEIVGEVSELAKEVLGKVLDSFEDSDLSKRFIDARIQRVKMQLDGYKDLGLTTDQAVALILKADVDLQVALQNLGRK